jgi:tetratricopeptide (TPR) repeat protein
VERDSRAIQSGASVSEIPPPRTCRSRRDRAHPRRLRSTPRAAHAIPGRSAQGHSGHRAAGLHPPPRSLIDVERLLVEQASAGAAELARYKAEADQKPPANASDATLVRFYRERGRAALAAGRPAQTIADLEQAVALVRRQPGRIDLGGVDLRDLLLTLSTSHRAAGDFAIAYRLAVDAWELGGNRGARIASATGVARTAVLIGDVSAARSMQDIYRDLEPGMSSQHFPREFVAINTATIRLTDGLIALAQGDPVAAERFLREALSHADPANVVSTRSATLFDQPTAALLVRIEARGGLAELYARDGRQAEAELEVRSALAEAVRRFGRSSSHTVILLDALAGVLLQQERIADAALLAERALDMAGHIGVARESYTLNRARRTLGTARLMQERPRDAAAAFELIENALARTPALFDAQFRPDPSWAIALVRNGAPARAERHLRASLAARETWLGTDGPGVSLLRGALAMAKRAAGYRAGALATYHAGDTIGTLLASAPA